MTIVRCTLGPKEWMHAMCIIGAKWCSSDHIFTKGRKNCFLVLLHVNRKDGTELDDWLKTGEVSSNCAPSRQFSCTACRNTSLDRRDGKCARQTRISCEDTLHRGSCFSCQVI